MIVPSDDDYQETKKWKKAGGPLPQPYCDLAKWIESHYGVQVAYIRYTAAPDNRSGLQVILEWEKDVALFHDSIGNFDRVKQEQIGTQFLSLLATHDIGGTKTDRLFVSFSAFEEVARVEANWRVTESDPERLKQQLNNRDLWKIHVLFDAVTFFFYTAAQAAEYEAKGFKAAYAEAYSQMVAPYDEFGYLAKRGILIGFDSKENFDKNYKGSWFNYDR